ncbi:hypothetical protein [Aurantiacibacter hainanensis]|uniref:hypothetical protein n=1 Tax=Aurantiacibacter hainanensis TaxID=3076114 RepID=UPI0030C7667B
MRGLCAVAVFALGLAACGSSGEVEEVTGDVENTAPEVEAGQIDPDTPPMSEQRAARGIPESLAPFGEGYPDKGDPCRRLGEAAATREYLDDSAVLVGCPTRASANELGGTVVASIDGVAIVSVPEGGRPQLSSPVAPGSVSGSVTGNEISSHRFEAVEEQSINVSLSGPGTMYFNVLPPGGSPGDAIFVGSQAQDADFWSGVAPATGQYEVIIYLMGNDRDTGVTRNYELEFVAG